MAIFRLIILTKKSRERKSTSKEPKIFHLSETKKSIISYTGQCLHCPYNIDFLLYSLLKGQLLPYPSIYFYQFKKSPPNPLELWHIGVPQGEKNEKKHPLPFSTERSPRSIGKGRNLGMISMQKSSEPINRLTSFRWRRTVKICLNFIWH